MITKILLKKRQRRPKSLTAEAEGCVLKEEEGPRGPRKVGNLQNLEEQGNGISLEPPEGTWLLTSRL